ncbi:type II secretion system F family protein [Kitasatospora sp. NBC_01287]|uniref:type II secretion system F family protein n=1 Tax=Kitasatospora sp. NBC_01287 TaxID=2903573 RepID=UPI00224F7FF2|nr:type II secretion system F family protein [Kitasatospora sp. NBC_01287]MCX4745242.1 type II secretion system F family protein [Kitasatospora sp. NBC_01287]
MTLLYALCGVLLVGGLVALVVGLTGAGGDPGAADGSGPSPLATRAHVLWYGAPGAPAPAVLRLRRIQLALSLTAAPLTWLFSRIALTVVLVPLIIFGFPWLFAVTRSDTRHIVRLEALADWTQRLSDVLLLGTGLNQALITSRRTAPLALRTEVEDLAARLQARWNAEDALRAFADSLADATADKVLAALLLRAGDSGPGLSRALADMADSVRDEVRQRRAIEADRAKHRTTVRWLVTIIFGVIVVGSFNTRYTAPYSTGQGQLVLAVLAAAFIGVIAWMRSLAAHKPLARLLEQDRRSRVGALPEPADPQEAAPDGTTAGWSGVPPYAGPSGAFGTGPGSGTGPGTGSGDGGRPPLLKEPR